MSTQNPPQKEPQNPVAGIITAAFSATWQETGFMGTRTRPRPQNSGLYSRMNHVWLGEDSRITARGMFCNGIYLFHGNPWTTHSTVVPEPPVSQ